MYNRKECKPEETVKKIKRILKKFKINVIEKEIININNSFYSTRVELKEIKGVGTNGKGITKEYALASAYAEFMERLQSNFLLKSSFWYSLGTITIYFSGLEILFIISL